MLPSNLDILKVSLPNTWHFHDCNLFLVPVYLLHFARVNQIIMSWPKPNSEATKKNDKHTNTKKDKEKRTAKQKVKPVDALKGDLLRISGLPTILQLHLMRFQFNWETETMSE